MFGREGSYQLLRLRAGGELALIEANPGEWILKKEWVLPERPAHAFTMASKDGEIVVQHEEQELYRIPQQAPIGIFVEEGEIKFLVSAATESPSGEAKAEP